ncbi:MAG: LmeA family phospholipid-binding protein [Candidatus Wallbacteria bacterium]|nr:LmeA family phospholipid-binding protein [Candidatus Wallbacteria bacterium]
MFFLIFSLLLCRDVSAEYTKEFYNDIVDNNGRDYLVKITESLKEHLQSQTVEVTADFGKVSETLGGKLKSARIEMKNGHFNLLKIEHALFVMYNPVIDVDKLWNQNDLILKKCEQIDFLIEIREQDLNEFLTTREGKLHVERPTVKLTDNEIQLKGYGEVLKVKVKFMINGKFELADRKKINFIPWKVKFNSIPLPKMMISKLVSRINPVLDLNDFPFDLQLEQIISKPEKLIFKNGDPK